MKEASLKELKDNREDLLPVMPGFVLDQMEFGAYHTQLRIYKVM